MSHLHYSLENIHICSFISCYGISPTMLSQKQIRFSLLVIAILGAISLFFFTMKTGEISLFPSYMVRVDRNPHIKTLEEYIFQQKPWTFPKMKGGIGPLNVHAELVDPDDLDLLPKTKKGRLTDLCRKFWENNTRYIEFGHEYMANFPRKPPVRIAKMAQNCSNFLQQRRYVTSPMTEMERKFPLAYSILAYKDSEQVERLVRAIYRPQNVICIHIDQKSGTDFVEDMFALTSCFPNVFIGSRRVDVQWGTVSLLLAELVCVRDLLKYEWKYYINLSGQEFPIRNNFELVSVFRMMRGSNDLESTIEDRDDDRYVHQYDLDGERTDDRVPPLPINVTVVKGNMHGTFSRGFIDFLLNDHKSKMFFDWVKLTKMPEETYFATINSNPQLGAPGAYAGKRVERRNLMSREIRWHRNCGGKLVRGVCVNGIADLKRLVNSRKFFLNKFHLDFEYLAFDCFERWFYERERLVYAGEEGVDLSRYRALIVPALRRDGADEEYVEKLKEWLDEY